MSDTPKNEETSPAQPQSEFTQAGRGAEPAETGSPEEQLAAAKAKVAEFDGHIRDLTDRLLRAHADMDNLRKRTEREKTDTAKYAITKFAGDMVAVADNFQRALTSVPADAAGQDGPIKSLLEGIEMVERAFTQALERHHVKRIDPTGELFNPHLHQAVMENPNPEVPSGTILQVYQVGYVIEDRLLRPASVVVARGGAKPARPPEAAGGPAPANDAGQPGDTSAEPGSGGQA